MPVNKTHIQHAEPAVTTAADIIRQLEHDASSGPLTVDTLKAAWSQSVAIEREQPRQDISHLYELRAIIVAHRGSADEAASYLARAKNTFAKGQSFISPNSEKFLAVYRARRSRQNKVRATIIAGIIAFIVLPLGFFAAYINSDDVVIARADPRMVALADRAGMTHTAKAIFLRADPKVLPKNQVDALCSNSNVANGEADGCYNPLTNEIYIRDMPQRFNDYETVVAAHEMLHAAFADGRADSVIGQLQAEAAAGHDEINKELQSYTFEDGQGADDELHSHLGTQAEKLNSGLERYYTQYFTNRAALATTYKAVLDVFLAKEAELSQQERDIEAAQAAAERLYGNHVAAAARGDRYSSDLLYAQYSKQYNEIERLLNDYNTAVTEYNSLVESFSGRPMETLEAPRFN